ncbi:MAG: glycosyltransferase [FCB group bacterium]|jgi:tetratricopeptide (TPR) repeat protein|nr:glycosyltransferase [FCB group bacterium]
MPTLSVVMIVKNEAECLDECLASISGIADEIVIGDTGSTDTTVAIAEWHRARVFSIPWNDDFAEARNAVLQQATGDWLLHLDADEVLDAGNARRIRELVDADGEGADAIGVTLANYSDDPRAWRWVPCHADHAHARGHAGFIAVELLRLFRNRPDFVYREPVHESITESVLAAGGAVRTEAVIIHHYGYAGCDANSDKAKRYLEIERRKVQERSDDPKAWLDFAEQLLAMGDTDEAEAACRAALELDRDNVSAATSLANILCNRGDLDEARGIFERFVERGGALPHMIMTLGAIACRQGRLEEGRRYLEVALEHAPDSVMTRLCYARTLDLSGNAFAARKELCTALETAPSLQETQNRIEAHRRRSEAESELAQNRPRQALAILVEALRLDSEDPLIHHALGETLHLLGREERAQQSFERARRLAPVYHVRSARAN